MKELRIILDGTTLEFGLKNDGARRGTFFVTYNLITELSKRDNVELCFYLNKNKSLEVKSYIKREWPELKCDFYIYQPIVLFKYYQKFSNIRLISSLLNAFIEYQKRKQKKYLEHFLRVHKSNIFFSTISKIPGIFTNTNLKKFTIIHDLIPIILKDYYAGKDFDWFYRLLNSINKRDYYFTDSENTKKDLIKYVKNVDKGHVFTSFVSCGNMFIHQDISDSIKKKYNIPLNKKYMFSLFTLDPKKNLERNISTFLAFKEKNKLDDICFVIGGGSDELNKDFKEQLNKKYKSDSYVFTGYIDDADLPALYSGAEWFVFTSMYEGFGLPPLEAMNCGCPVIVSNSSSLPEVVGDAGIQIDWNSDEQHITAYEKYYFDKAFRDNSVQKGLVQAKKFSWNKIVDFMIEKMTEVI